MKLELAPGFYLEFNMEMDFLDFILNGDKRMKKQYYETYEMLLNFQSDTNIILDADLFDKKMFDRLMYWLVVPMCTPLVNILNHVAVLKNFFKNKYPDQDFRHVRIQFKGLMNSVYPLTKEELDIVQKVSVNGNTKQEVKDLFIFMANTGIRYQDCFELKLIETYEQPPILNFVVAKEITERYGGLPPRVDESIFNQVIKQILSECEIDRCIAVGTRLVPIWETANLLTAHQTFISLMFEQEIPLSKILRMGKYKDYKDLLSYIFH